MSRCVPLLETVLVRAGYATMTASNGSAALEMLTHDPIDLVLIDVRLPACRVSRSSSARLQGRIPRVVVMTGDTAPGVALRGHPAAGVPVHRQAVHVGRAARARASRAADRADHAASRGAVGDARWVELLVPCDREVADHIHETLMASQGRRAHRGAGGRRPCVPRAAAQRRRVGRRLRRQQASADLVRARPQGDPLRISDPGHGFVFDGLSHAAVTNFDRDPLRARAHARGEGHAPGRDRDPARPVGGRRADLQRGPERGRVHEVPGRAGRGRRPPRRGRGKRAVLPDA